MAQFLMSGDTMDFTPAVDVDSGEVVVVGNIVAISNDNISANTLGTLTKTGIFRIPKDDDTGPVFAIGDPVYFDTATEFAVKTGGVYAGICTKDAATGDAFVETSLNEILPAAFDGKVWEEVTLVGGSKVLDSQDVGKVLNTIGSATNVITLPATAPGLMFVVRAASDGVRIAISPNSSDLIASADVAGTDDGDRILAAATAKAGDYIALIGNGTTGWFVFAERGVWANA